VCEFVARIEPAVLRGLSCIEKYKGGSSVPKGKSVNFATINWKSEYSRTMEFQKSDGVFDRALAKAPLLAQGLGGSFRFVNS
jgi:hypothetical protein